MGNDFKVGEDWTDSDKDFDTSGTLKSGAQTVTGDVDASGEITGASIVQGSETVLDESDLVAGGGAIIGESNIVNTGPSAPTSTFAGKLWFDTGNNLLKMRNEADNAWLDIWDTANNKPIITNLSLEILTAMIADNAIDKDKINADVAGLGLVQNVDGSLEVNPDDVTLEVSGDAIQVKADGIDTAQIADDAVEASQVADGAIDTAAKIADGIITPAKLSYKGALVILNSNQSIADGGDDAIDFDSEFYDTDGFWAAGNPERFTVPAGVSYIVVRAKLDIFVSVSTDNSMTISIYKNGSSTPYDGMAQITIVDRAWASNEFDTLYIETAPIPVNENDYFHIQFAWVDNTGNGNVTAKGGAGGNSCWFAIEVKA